MKQHYIYLTTNNINQMKYIGQHYGELDDTYLGSGKLLKEAIKEYGRQNFTKTILHISSNEEENDRKEIEYIALYNATSNPIFYNIHKGGSGGNTTMGYSEEEKAALSRKLSELSRGEKNGMYGKHHTPETKEFLSYWAKFKRDNSVYRTEEFRQKMSNVTIGEKNGMYGKKHSEESKLKMSINSKGKALGEKNGMYGKKGDLALNGKRVEMYDENMTLIRTFNAKTAVLEDGTMYKGYFWNQVDKNQD